MEHLKEKVKWHIKCFLPFELSASLSKQKILSISMQVVILSNHFRSMFLGILKRLQVKIPIIYYKNKVHE